MTPGLANHPSLQQQLTIYSPVCRYIRLHKIRHCIGALRASIPTLENSILPAGIASGILKTLVADHDRLGSITRRLRELNIFSEMLPCTQKLSELKFTPKGIILSGGPYSVYEEGSPHVDPTVFDLSGFSAHKLPSIFSPPISSMLTFASVRCAHPWHLLCVQPLTARGAAPSNHTARF
jgi:hypothetical protein